MDEPLSNLDAKLRLEMRAEIRRIHGLLGSSTIYVTHDQDEALSLADRIVVLRDGAVRQIGTPEELYKRPAHADVAEFMGYRNVLPTQMVDGHVTVGGVAMPATPIDLTGDGAGLAAIRPDDLLALSGGPLPANVVSAEYRGRDFYGIARATDGTELHFRSEYRVAPGDAICLGVEPGRVLVFAA
jgi:putative spermidine/putrescine transport system ATP-binding protein